MKNLIFIAHALLLLLGAGCKQKPTPKPLPVMIYATDDLSSTYNAAQKLEASLLVDLANGFLSATHPTTVLAAHVSQKQSNPVTLKLTPFTGSLDKMSLHYKEEANKKAEIDSLNTTAIQQFQQDFAEQISGFELIPKETDYSFINVHLQSIAHFLEGDATTLRIAVISTDFIDDEPKKKAVFADETVIQQLNRALASKNAFLYVITSASTENTALAQLDANFISSWTEFKTIIETKFSNSQTL